MIKILSILAVLLTSAVSFADPTPEQAQAACDVLAKSLPTWTQLHPGFYALPFVVCTSSASGTACVAQAAANPTKEVDFTSEQAKEIYAAFENNGYAPEPDAIEAGRFNIILQGYTCAPTAAAQ